MAALAAAPFLTLFALSARLASIPPLRFLARLVRLPLFWCRLLVDSPIAGRGAALNGQVRTARRQRASRASRASCVLRELSV